MASVQSSSHSPAGSSSKSSFTTADFQRLVTKVTGNPQESKHPNEAPLGWPGEVDPPATSSQSSTQGLVTTKGWSIKQLLASGKQFRPVPTISASAPRHIISQKIQEHEDHGEPLIISGWHELPSWPKDLFSIESLLANSDDRCMSHCLRIGLTHLICLSRHSGPQLR